MALKCWVPKFFRGFWCYTLPLESSFIGILTSPWASRSRWKKGGSICWSDGPTFFCCQLHACFPCKLSGARAMWDFWNLAGVAFQDTKLLTTLWQGLLLHGSEASVKQTWGRFRLWEELDPLNFFFARNPWCFQSEKETFKKVRPTKIRFGVQTTASNCESDCIVLGL